MSYRNVRKVLGETNLERKCRFLFGIALVTLIFGTFYWIWQTTTQLIYEHDQLSGRNAVDSAMLIHHWAEWDTKPVKPTTPDGHVTDGIIDLTKHLVTNQVKVLKDDDADAKWPGITCRFLYLEDTQEKSWEHETLLILKHEMEEQLAAKKQAELDAVALEGQPDAVPPPDADTFAPVFRERPRSETSDEYHYYQPVYWKESCNSCHAPPVGALSAADTEPYFGSAAPLCVAKVVMPYGPTQQSLHWNLAMLWTAGVITVTLGMMSLYAIVKYVIVKPLSHLRDVSEEISRGNTSLRADIHTGDEFEELADSFNRMLRHMTDAQSELRGVNEDLDAKVDELAQANLQLYEMNRLKGDFLANMSHELRTPLNSIIGFSEVLQGNKALDEKQRRYASNIQKSGRLLLEMINDILDLAKMESGKMEVRPSEFAISAVIAVQCDLVRSLAEEKNIDLVIDENSSLPVLYQDQGKVQQILTNLLSNAIKFTPEGGRITVSAQRVDAEQLRLTVDDTGVGIAEEDRETIFEKFRQATDGVRGDNLTREYSGTGLGLSIVKELCKLLGGEITFESDLGKGSSFIVTLPWTRADQPQRQSNLSSRLDELTKPKRSDLLRTSPATTTPPTTPPVASEQTEV
jgi:two-component system sensor histidine kinase BarA